MVAFFVVDDAAVSLRSRGHAVLHLIIFHWAGCAATFE
jgi:hypothetical protein